MMGSTDPRKPVKPSRPQKTRHPKKTQVWKLVMKEGKTGILFPWWQTTERVKVEGRWTVQVINLAPGDVPLMLQVESQRPVGQRRRVIFEPWDD
jgi:hypothetical protein